MSRHLSMRSGNPALNPKVFDFSGDIGNRMTLEGTVNKTGISLLILMACAAYTWNTWEQRMGPG